MKMTRTASLLLAALLIMAALAGCGQVQSTTQTTATAGVAATAAQAPTDAPTQAPADTSVAITDMTGREITLDAPATRVVALSPADCEIIYAIGAGDTLVGRGAYCDYPAQVADVTAVEAGAGMNIEEVIALDPQVIIMTKMAQTKEQVAQLEAAGIKVVVSDAQDIDGTYTAIELIGAIVGKQENAQALAQSMKDAFDEVKNTATGDGTQTIYFEVSPLEYGLWTAGSGTFMNEVTEMLGMKNCFADIEGWGEISQEQVIARNPDYIVTIAMYFGEGPTPQEEIMGRAGWENITAVKNEAILNLADNELSRPGPRLADGARQLCEFIYK